MFEKTKGRQKLAPLDLRLWWNLPQSRPARRAGPSWDRSYARMVLIKMCLPSSEVNHCREIWSKFRELQFSSLRVARVSPTTRKRDRGGAN